MWCYGENKTEIKTLQNGLLYWEIYYININNQDPKMFNDLPFGRF